MLKKRLISSNKGFTLVETIVAIAIASIVSLIAINLFSFSNKTLSKSEDRSFNQMSVRNASISITDKLRYAKNLEILENDKLPVYPIVNSDPNLDQNYKYIFFNKQNNCIIHLEYQAPNWKVKKYLENKLNLDIDLSDSLKKKEKSYFKLLEEDPDPERKIRQITFKVTGKGDKYKKDVEDYSLETKVNLLNSDLDKYKPNGIVDKELRGVRFK